MEIMYVGAPCGWLYGHFQLSCFSLDLDRRAESQSMSHLPGFGHGKSYGHALGQRFWAPVSVQILQFPVFWLPSHFVPLFLPSRNRDESTITEGYV